MNSITQEQLDSFKAFVESHSHFIIAGHKEPDGDCVCSCLGISYILDFFKKDFLLVNAGPFKRSEIKGFANQFTNTIPFMSDADRKNTGLIIADCCEASRLGELEVDISGLDTFIIDHHKTSEADSKNSIIDSTSPAASCLVQELYEKLCGLMSQSQAETLFFGLATDTGFFRYLTQNDENIFNAAARLVKNGANPKKTYQQMTGGKPWSTRKLLGLLLDKAERYAGGRLAVTYETLEDTKRYGQEGRDSDALYSSLLSVEGIEAVAFIRQDTETTCTMGLRSKDSCDVSAIAAKFGGGGHKNASGASCNGRIENIKPLLIKEFSKVL